MVLNYSEIWNPWCFYESVLVHMMMYQISHDNSQTGCGRGKYLTHLDKIPYTRCTSLRSVDVTLVMTANPSKLFKTTGETNLISSSAGAADRSFHIFFPEPYSCFCVFLFYAPPLHSNSFFLQKWLIFSRFRKRFQNWIGRPLSKKSWSEILFSPDWADFWLILSYF